MARRPRPLSDEQLFPSLQGQGIISVDCESWDPELKTKGPGWHRDDTYIAGVAIGTEAGFRGYYPVAHDGPGNMDEDKVFRWLDHELKTETPKCGAHLLYDLGFLEESNVRVRGPLWDVQNAEPLLNENKFTYSLESLSKQYLGIGKLDDELDDWIRNNINEPDAKKNPKRYIAKAPAHIVAPYAIGDVDHPLKIFAQQRPELERQGLWDVFTLETKLIPLLYRMRRRGVPVDLNRAEEMLARLRSEQRICQDKMRHLAGFDVQVWAAASLAKAFDAAGLLYPRTPRTNKPSFTKPFLERVDHPLAKLVLEDRRLDKMCGTFLEGCILDAHYKGRIHCQFNQQKSDDGGAVSGRFSSSNPNLQFIPERTEEGKLIRSIFIAEPGLEWGKPDYSQIEFRLMVHDAVTLGLPGAQAIADEYINDPDTDFHEVVAEIVYGGAFTDVQRKRGKTINFGIAFGEGKDKLASQLGVALAEALQILATYHRKIPFMSKLAEGSSRIAATEGQIETLFGRIRRFPWGKTKWNDDGTNTTVVLPHRVPGAKRVFTHKALNARIQGSAADIMKEAMVQLDEDGIFDYLGDPYLTVHDELDLPFELNARGVEAMKHVKHVMENVTRLEVPLVVSLASGRNWGEAKDWVDGLPVGYRPGSPRRRAA
jgi:DNA polymerase I-like protein with 3'-5' exonuclease and polymerase domains